MKKTDMKTPYVAPAFELVEIEAEGVLCDSSMEGNIDDFENGGSIDI